MVEETSVSEIFVLITQVLIWKEKCLSQSLLCSIIRGMEENRLKELRSQTHKISTSLLLQSIMKS